MNFSKVLIGSFLIASVVLVAGCKKNDEVKIPYGPFSATGTLVRADVSLIRRGTHILLIEGKQTYFVESRTQNMRELEGSVVYVEGKLEPNATKTDLPVLVATSVKRSHGDEDLHRFEIPALNLRLGVPESWGATIQKNVASFLLPGETLPILSIRLMSGSTLPPGGSALFVKNRRGTKISSIAGGSDVYILEKGTVIHIHFDPSSQDQLKTVEDAAIAAAEFERILGSISFMTDKDVPTVTTGSGAGMPCGGSAGVLCPAGYFCNVVDTVERIGQCKKR